MTLSREEVLRVAYLARLHLRDDEVPLFAAQLSQIVELVNQLREVDTSDVEPMVHAIEGASVLRDDVPTPSLERDEVLANAPHADGEYFLVPPVF